MHHHFKLKPISANRMFYKAKSKTREYREYQDDIRMQVILEEGDKFVWPFEDSQVSFDVKVGLSNKQADLDNIIKPCLDTYQSMYADFNDNKVYYVQLEKFIVKKGEEYLDVTITEYSDN